LYKIALVSMPFAAADIPSIALTQLQSALARELGDRVSCEILYLNLDFVNYLGYPVYEAISMSVQANTAGLGDWFFSQEAFPELPDQTELYLTRHFAEQRAQFAKIRGPMLAKRQTVGVFLQRLIDRYHLADYSLVGFTSMFSQNTGSFAVARRLKERRPEVVVVMGGANCEAPMGAVIAKNVEAVDFVFSGPALRSFPRLVGRLLDGNEAECHRIPGILSRRKLALTQAAQCHEIGEELDIDENLELDYDGYFTAFDRKLEGLPIKPRVPFETSRGCWWGERSHCTFCGLNGGTMKYRAMSPDQAVEQLQQLFARYGSRVVEFESVDNILPREYLRDVLPRLTPPPHANLFYEVKADLKEHEIAILEQARVTRIQPGIEALSTSSLKLMKKGTTAFQNLRFLMHCQAYRVTPNWNLLVGFPNEPESVYQKYYEDIPLLTHLYPPGGVFPVRFDRFSPYFKLAAEYGLKLRPSDFYAMIYPFPSEDLENLAYFFRDADFQSPYLISTARWLGKLRERVAQWQALWAGDVKPELTLEDRGADAVVIDSRTGSRTEHPIGPVGRQVLNALGQHRRLPSLVEKLAGFAADVVAREVDSLRQLGLLFEEDGYYLSLVPHAEGERQAKPALGRELKTNPGESALQALS
jgi:magnesium-protoporphyrin IX monomethyl ester (oxidative) cyclase